MDLVSTYAQNHGIMVSQQEVQDPYHTEIARTNLSESAYFAKLQAMYGVSKEDHLEQIREELLKSRVQSAVGKPLVTWLKEQEK